MNMKASTVRVAEVNQAAVTRYKEMRSALLPSEDGDERRWCEIVITSQLALLGHEVPFKLHAIRLFELKVSKEQLERVILWGVGVTFLLPQAAQVLDWIDEAHRSFVAG
ncbi:hypothetical protein [Variovorax sp. HJSM1_2]|uniref:hypothetical protein n=1 Tax=Variovorax sp. HJSM1_2 TaxID=3366263 RepID=UPI003BE9EB75